MNGTSHSTDQDRGAEMVEFAIVLPVLLLLVLGIIEFGFLLHEQATLAGAAREGARDMAIHNNANQAETVTVAAAQPLVDLTTAGANVAVSPAVCEPGVNVTVTATYTHSSLTGVLAMIDRATPIQLTGKGVMRCGG